MSIVIKNRSLKGVFKMKIEVIENEKDKLKISVHKELTLVNLLNENIWKADGVSAYKLDHPYLGEPILLVRGSNPKKQLLDASLQIVADAKDLRKQAQVALK